MVTVSLSRLFVVAFLGTLFAIMVALLLVYTYVTLRLVPKLKRGVHKYVEEIGPKALFEQANVDPRELGLSPAKATQTKIVFTCEDHGRCGGCPKVLAQFEAIRRHQGNLDEIEQLYYEQLKDQLVHDEPLPGESETDRQKRIADRVVEALIHEGFVAAHARGVVWAIRKDDRATFGMWLSAARESCEKFQQERVS